MSIRPSLLCAVAALALSGTASYAQDPDTDVLIMRRAIATPKGTSVLRPVEGADLEGYYWVTSDWLKGEPSCSATVEQTRLRGCVYKGAQANEANCPQPAPSKTRLVEDYQACNYEWTTTVSGDWAETCAQTTRPVTAECQRLGTGTVDDSFCADMPKPTTISGFNEEGCTYSWAIGEWGGWKSQCSEQTSRERVVECLRMTGTVASDSLCEQPKPEALETGENYSNCAYRWSPSAWKPDESSCGGEVRQTRTVSCQRTDGQPADEELCVDPLPDLEKFDVDYSACTHEWVPGDWGDWSSQCSTQSVRKRTVSCRREDGESVDAQSCTGPRPQDEETSEILTGCSYSWSTGDWSTTPQCSASAESTRTVTCRRTDGKVMEDSFCAGQTRPEATKTTADYADCTYGWSAGTIKWDSQCSDSATGTRTVTCKRSDGALVSDHKCVAANKPAATITESNYEGCASTWATGEWGAWSSQCSDTAKRDRAVQCIQQKPEGPVSVTTDNCDDATRPVLSEEMAIYTGCTAQWSTGVWGWNGVAGAKSSTCSGTPEQERTVVCRQRMAPDGEYQTVDSSLCTETKPITKQTLTPIYESCTYEWSPGQWSDWDSLCSATARRTRTTQCLRKDGSNTPVSTSYCDPNAEGARTVDVQEVVIDCGGSLKNSGFEQGFAEWTSSPYYDHISSDAYSGEKAADLGGTLSQVIEVNATPANTINVTFMCKQKGRLPYFRMQFSASGMATQIYSYQCTGSAYRQFSQSFTPTVNVKDLTIRFFPYDGSVKNAALLDDVILTVK